MQKNKSWFLIVECSEGTHAVCNRFDNLEFAIEVAKSDFETGILDEELPMWRHTFVIEGMNEGDDHDDDWQPCFDLDPKYSQYNSKRDDVSYLI